MEAVLEQASREQPALATTFIGLEGSEQFKYILRELASGQPNPKQRRHLVSQVREAIKACASAQRQACATELYGRDWIKVDQALPAPYEEVRILYDGVPRIARLNHSREYFQLATFIDSTKSQYIASFDRVAGWMSLPAAPALEAAQ